MMLVTDLDLPLLDTLDPQVEARFHELVQDLRAEGRWIVRTPLGHAVIEHDAVRDLLREPRLHTLGARLFEMQGVEGGEVLDGFRRSILNLEGAEHTRLRRLVSRAFTPRAADRLRPMMREWVERRATAMAERGGGDLMAELAEAYPIAVICELVGAPERDWPSFSAWATDVFRIFRMNLTEDLPVIREAQRSMRDYTEELIRQRRDGAPRDDLISELLRIEDEGDRLSHDELCGLVMSVILAGTDTTRNQLGLTVMLLARRPDQWARLVADPSLVPRAVEEALRFDATASSVPRVAAEELTYRGVTIPAGSVVVLGTATANRDPDHVACPMELDVTRDRSPWSPFTFGGGAHYCLGAALARAELQEALGVLVRRWPRIELDGTPEMKPRQGLYGPVHLPVRILPA